MDQAGRSREQGGPLPRSLLPIPIQVILQELRQVTTAAKAVYRAHRLGRRFCSDQNTTPWLRR